ncbi:hypothetical protein EK904_013096 [Melospiza melodia maxima]|nr:hypothetical protein EK904_013096 [Melospiza melodia maxima]
MFFFKEKRVIAKGWVSFFFWFSFISKQYQVLQQDDKDCVTVAHSSRKALLLTPRWQPGPEAGSGWFGFSWPFLLQSVLVQLGFFLSFLSFWL